MQSEFVFSGLPMRVLFGAGTISRLPEEVTRLGMRRPLVVSTPEQRDQAEGVIARLGEASSGGFFGARMHTPVAVTEEALAVLSERRADGLVAFGGGSTTGLSKALALRTDLPQIAIPTTYAGSEMTPILGETRDGEKHTIRSERVLPETTIYDVEFTTGLPVAMSVTSGLNAIAHAVEALYAPDRNPIISLMAETATAALVRALPAVIERPDDIGARTEALYGAWLCGVALGAVGMGLHHKLCHTLGGSFDLPHAPTHAVVLPYALAYNAAAAPEAVAALRRVMGEGDVAVALHRFGQRIGAPSSLADLGLDEGNLDRAADLAAARPYPNPRPIERGAIRALLDDAYHGRPPGTSAGAAG
ncbi:maleylacetate reductase [Lichenicoccus roseus]|uniref:Maleylacetate reductase n=1 Tax=Lichenicoccus roseus TaxID=2683649 RepID=A0A5R9J9U2_9PROT|nr:maleylacetate reductase [Lichenicoccus roseus]TLU74370.1 maleylacetate reductase [Lichenicoccus roseus]